jgi:hypothetical protein
MRSLTLRIAAAVAVVAGGLGVLSSTPVLAAHSRDDDEVLAQTCGGNTNAPWNFNAGQGWFQVPSATLAINDEGNDDHEDKMPATGSAVQGRIQVPGAAVTIKNDDDVRNVVTTFSVDANVDPNAVMFLSTFTVDGGAPVANAYGPGNLGGNSPSGMSRRTIESVIPLGEGTHTIYAWVQVNGNWWNWGQVGNFCLVVKDSEEDD